MEVVFELRHVTQVFSSAQPILPVLMTNEKQKPLYSLGWVGNHCITGSHFTTKRVRIILNLLLKATFYPVIKIEAGIQK